MEHPNNHADLLADLNEPQRRAVVHRDGPLLVIAGPGSGKTRVITRRAAQLVREGVEPRHILAITFTNKAADEMKRRIEALGVAGGMWVYTFHALGVRLLREFGEAARVRPGFTIYDEDDRAKVVKEAIAECGYSESIVKPPSAVLYISHNKNELRTPVEAQAAANVAVQQQFASIYAAYQRLLEQRNAVDFDDLLMRVALVLQTDAAITERLNRRFRYLLIDEYQDTNHAQYLIARQLSRYHGNICATGDPDQSIYAWRGANMNNILDFEQDYPSAVVVKLEQNYRSTGKILAAADSLIAHNTRRKAKRLFTAAGPGEPVRVWRFASGGEEADHIGATIASLHRAGQAYGEIAICYRVNALSRGLEEALRLRGIPYQIVRGVEFYNRKEIKDVVAYLRLLVNPADDVALIRVINTPARGIGKTTLDRLIAEAQAARRPLIDVVRAAGGGKVGAFAALLDELTALAQTGTPLDAVNAVLGRTGLEAAVRAEDEVAGEDRYANVQEFVTAVAKYEQEQAQEQEAPTLENFLYRVALVNDQDAIRDASGAVLLMTLHAAKGLEFPVVFLAGVEQGLLPHERVLRELDPDERMRQLEEERRLCFVGITRAQRQLYLTYADERTVRGQRVAAAPSQFLQELSEEACETRSFGVLRDDSRDLGGGRRFVSESDFDRDGSAWRDRGHGGFAARQRGGPGRSGYVRPGDRAIAGGRRRFGESDDNESGDRIIRREDEAPIPAVAPAADSRFAGWAKGTLVQHDRYGVGQIVWITPAPGQTRAGIKFAGVGEKTFVLDFTPIRKLER